MLETRLAPAINVWHGDGVRDPDLNPFGSLADWNDGQHWSLGHVPGSPGHEDDEVHIKGLNALGGNWNHPHIKLGETFTIRGIFTNEDPSETVQEHLYLHGVLNVHHPDADYRSTWHGAYIGSYGGFTSPGGALRITGGSFDWNSGNIDVKDLDLSGGTKFNAFKDARRLSAFRMNVGRGLESTADFFVGSPDPAKALWGHVRADGGGRIEILPGSRLVMAQEQNVLAGGSLLIGTQTLLGEVMTVHTRASAEHWDPDQNGVVEFRHVVGSAFGNQIELPIVNYGFVYLEPGTRATTGSTLPAHVHREAITNYGTVLLTADTRLIVQGTGLWSYAPGIIANVAGFNPAHETRIVGDVFMYGGKLILAADDSSEGPGTVRIIGNFYAYGVDIYASIDLDRGAPTLTNPNCDRLIVHDQSHLGPNTRLIVRTYGEIPRGQVWTYHLVLGEEAGYFTGDWQTVHWVDYVPWGAGWAGDPYTAYRAQYFRPFE
jgi:hypothetical protein